MSVLTTLRRIPVVLRWAVAAVVAAVVGLLMLATRPVAGVDGTLASGLAAAPASAGAFASPAPAPAPGSSEAARVARPAPWPSTGWLAPPGAGTPATPALSLAELREVQATLATAPQAGAEQTALAEAMFFADVAQRFHQVLSTGHESEPGELKSLAQMLDAALDTRLLRGDISWPDARLVKASVLGALHPQDAALQEQVEDWEIRLRQGPLRAAPGAAHPPR